MTFSFANTVQGEASKGVGSSRSFFAWGSAVKVQPEEKAAKGGVTHAVQVFKDFEHGIEEEWHSFSNATRQLHRFYYMEKDARCIFGLQDWSTNEWQQHLAATGPEGLAFAQCFLGRSALYGASTVDGEEGAPAEASLSTARRSSTAANPNRLDPAKVAHLIKAKVSELLPVSEWKQVVKFQNLALNLHDDPNPSAWYLDQNVLNNFIFEREFPLGVEERLCLESDDFVVANSGLHEIRHKQNKIISALVYCFMAFIILVMLYFLGDYMTMKTCDVSAASRCPPEIWTLAATLQDASDPFARYNIDARTHVRSTVASCLQAFSFSLTVNACLDKFGKVDPSSSTVRLRGPQPDVPSRDAALTVPPR